MIRKLFTKEGKITFDQIEITKEYKSCIALYMENLQMLLINVMKILSLRIYPNSVQSRRIYVKGNLPKGNAWQF